MLLNESYVPHHIMLLLHLLVLDVPTSGASLSNQSNYI